MNDQQYFLANAYVDGDLTADERAIAEADPEVMSEVEMIRALQVEVRTVEPASVASREAAIAAAMAQFAPAAATPPPAPVPARHAGWFRPRYQRSLAIAAAVVAVGLLGVIVVNIDRGGDDDGDVATADLATDAGDDSSSDEAASDDGDDAADTGEARDLTESQPAADDTIAASAEAADVAGDAGDMAEAAPAAGDDAVLGADDMADSDDMADDRDMAGDDGEAFDLPPGVIPIVPALEAADPTELPDPAVLGEVGAELNEQRASNSLGATPETTCDFPDADDPSEILDRTEFVTEGGTVELLVAVDDVNGIVSGIDPDTCEILVVGPLR